MARRWLIATITSAWIVVMLLGGREIYTYATTAGREGDSLARWPAASSLPHANRELTLTMFVHPECSCTRASLAELASIMQSRHATVTIVFIGTSEGGGTWDAAAAIPGARRLHDPEGIEAARFGAATSGHVVIFDAAGTRRFTGGITGSRGHAGDNMGRRQVEALLDGQPSGDAHHTVFGCALRDAS